MNSFGVPNSKVANEPGKNPKELVKPFGRLGRITAVDREIGRHRLPMAHNVLDGRVTW